MTRVNLPATVVDYVVMGTCIQAEVALQANIAARQVLLKSGLPPETLSLSIDRACCSSLTAVHLGVKEIVTGGAEAVLAIGSDNMGRAPYLVPRHSGSQRVGHQQMIDPLYELGYADWAPVAVDAAEVAIEHGVTREQQDRWAYRSQQRYAEALAAGKFSEEIISVEAIESGNPRTILERDEQPRPNTTLDDLARLSTVYGSPTVTAGNAPGLNAGAAAVLLMSRERAQALKVEPLARIVANASVALSPRYMATAPAAAIQKVLDVARLTLDDLELIEINEAFAAVPLVSSLVLAKGDEEGAQRIRARLNVNGGAVAVGHLVGASGARLLMTAMYELRRRHGGYAAIAICGGLAQGDATIIHV